MSRHSMEVEYLHRSSTVAKAISGNFTSKHSKQLICVFSMSFSLYDISADGCLIEIENFDTDASIISVDVVVNPKTGLHDLIALDSSLQITSYSFNEDSLDSIDANFQNNPHSSATNATRKGLHRAKITINIKIQCSKENCFNITEELEDLKLHKVELWKRKEILNTSPSIYAHENNLYAFLYSGSVEILNMNYFTKSTGSNIKNKMKSKTYPLQYKSMKLRFQFESHFHYLQSEELILIPIDLSQSIFAFVEPLKSGKSIQTDVFIIKFDIQFDIVVCFDVKKIKEFYAKHVAFDRLTNSLIMVSDNGINQYMIDPVSKKIQFLQSVLQKFSTSNFICSTLIQDFQFDSSHINSDNSNTLLLVMDRNSRSMSIFDSKLIRLGTIRLEEHVEFDEILHIRNNFIFLHSKIQNSFVMQLCVDLVGRNIKSFRICDELSSFGPFMQTVFDETSDNNVSNAFNSFYSISGFGLNATLNKFDFKISYRSLMKFNAKKVSFVFSILQENSIYLFLQFDDDKLRVLKHCLITGVTKFQKELNIYICNILSIDSSRIAFITDKEAIIFNFQKNNIIEEISFKHAENHKCVIQSSVIELDEIYILCIFHNLQYALINCHDYNIEYMNENHNTYVYKSKITQKYVYFKEFQGDCIHRMTIQGQLCDYKFSIEENFHDFEIIEKASLILVSSTTGHLCGYHSETHVKLEDFGNISIYPLKLLRLNDIDECLAYDQFNIFLIYYKISIQKLHVIRLEIGVNFFTQVSICQSQSQSIYQKYLAVLHKDTIHILKYQLDEISKPKLIMREIFRNTQFFAIDSSNSLILTISIDNMRDIESTFHLELISLINFKIIATEIPKKGYRLKTLVPMNYKSKQYNIDETLFLLACNESQHIDQLNTGDLVYKGRLMIFSAKKLELKAEHQLDCIYSLKIIDSKRFALSTLNSIKIFKITPEYGLQELLSTTDTDCHITAITDMCLYRNSALLVSDIYYGLMKINYDTKLNEIKVERLSHDISPDPGQPKNHNQAFVHLIMQIDELKFLTTNYLSQLNCFELQETCREEDKNSDLESTKKQFNVANLCTTTIPEGVNCFLPIPQQFCNSCQDLASVSQISTQPMLFFTSAGSIGKMRFIDN